MMWWPQSSPIGRVNWLNSETLHFKAKDSLKYDDRLIPYYSLHPSHGGGVPS
uniref:Uncharacterized protein n=1 Tax=Klebsiella pneumoniae TaxID=573 RepID=A0A8B0STT4_KLEPN|nr:hypothetical protein [Klebsiella pneumoniae]